MIDLSDQPLPMIPERVATAHKGDFGHAWIVGGSSGMSGAPSLSGVACLRSGAGLVNLVVPACAQQAVASHCPDYMALGIEDDGQRFAPGTTPSIISAIEGATAIAIGSGLGRATHLTGIVVQLVDSIPQPLVIDADALYALAQQPETLQRSAGPRVLTPHAGELARLRGAKLNDPNDDAERLAAARDLARRDARKQTVVLLKGTRTVITDGDHYAVNATGNPGMATGGSGDVLTGVITALLCQGLTALDAARLGAYVHGLAGDLAAEEVGQLSLTASDLVAHLSAAWKTATSV